MVTRSLRFRIALTIFCLEVVMVALVLWIVVATLTDATRTQFDAKEDVVSELLARVSRTALLTEDFAELGLYFAHMRLDPGVERIFLIDPESRVLVSTEPKVLGELFPVFSAQHDHRWRVEDIANVAGPLGTLAIEFSGAEFAKARDRAVRLGMAVAAASMVVIALVGLLVGFLLTRRLERLTDAADSLRRGDFEVRARLGGRDEISALASTFDAMAERIQVEREALQKANLELETRVEARTAELSAARDEAERANRAKSEFLSRMSHELRTPLNAILGFSQLLEQEVTTPEQADSVQEILKAGDHLLALINEVLDLARVESGRLALDHERIELETLIEECEVLIRSSAQARGVSVERSFCDEGLVIQGDRMRLKQVLLNLLSNAVKYNRANGRVRMRCGRSDGWVRFEVEDTGQGLTPEQQARLFVPFERLDADRLAIEGSGIGLALSKSLVELMQGRIGVESVSGEGSTFWVVLPDLACGQTHESTGDDDPSPETSSTGPVPEDFSERTVLCIEDDPASLRLICQALSRYTRLRVLSAVTAENGLALALDSTPDLMLVDINLPELDGFDVLKCLREHQATSLLPVVAVTASAMPDDVIRGKQAGFDDYLTKPLDIQALERVLRRFLSD